MGHVGESLPLQEDQMGMGKMSWRDMLEGLYETNWVTRKKISNTCM